jgi:transposase
MSQVKNIKKMYDEGASIAEISRVMKLSEPTVRKYIKMDDYSPTPPTVVPRPSKLDPYKDEIERWIAEDGGRWYKQRHCATRVYDRLLDETGYDGSYSVVQRFVKELKESIKDRGYLDLVWAPATAQVDFGQADFLVYGQLVRMHYMVVSFPHSNVGLAQVFYGENAECVCEGLLRIFMFIGGVPRICIFDNATGVGKRFADSISLTELFSRFELHYGFEVRFCNPNSGHEKGNVENMVGTLRRNLFVPMPEVWELDDYNSELLDRCMQRAEATHYRKGRPCKELFKEDLKSFKSLPEKPFSCIRYEIYKADKTGNICVGGKHRYSAAPELYGHELVVGFGAYAVQILDERGNIIATHPRLYGESSAESIDPSTSLRLLSLRPGAWENSHVRYSMPDELRTYIDESETSMIKTYLLRIAEVAYETDYETAIKAAYEVCHRTGQLKESDLTIYASRLYSGSEIVYEEPVDLGQYDAVYGGEEMVF